MKSRPRTGSLLVRPRKRAKKETPSFRSFPVATGKTKPQNFLGYKAGMLHVFAKNERPKSASVGQEVAIPATIVECPPLRVFAARGYCPVENGYGTRVCIEINAEKTDKHLPKKINSFRKKHQKKEEGTKENRKEGVLKTWSDLEKIKGQLGEVRLLVHTQPSETNFGKKKPDVSEIVLNGTIDEQLAFAREKLGQLVSIKEVFEPGQIVDVKAVTKGKGFQGVIKRHHVKMQRHKAKKPRTVGAISPWHPPTVMWTVARPGQMGYHARTEFNKKILEIGEAGKKIAPANGFGHYGTIENDFVVIAGSIPGPAKRCVALRTAMRNVNPNAHKWGKIEWYSTQREREKQKETAEETPKLEKVHVEKEHKQEKKSVEEELAEAAKAKK